LRGVTEIEIDGKICTLFYEGDVSLLDDISKNVAVVGLTNPTAEIEKRERTFVRKLVENGFNIVSGLAKGCDTIAHDECIKTGGRTIAILPTPLDKIYPAENKILARNIVENGGLLITEYNSTPVNRGEAIKRFIERDRLQAWFSTAVMLTASYRKGEGDSGSRHAMAKAGDYGRKRYVMFNSEIDSEDVQFGLNKDLLNQGLEILSNKTLENLNLPDKFVFDLEGTLVHTDELNTKCYNDALQKFGHKPILNIKRVTRNNKITDEKIYKEKQQLFLERLNEVKLNDRFVKILRECKDNAVIFTSSDAIKARAILKHFDLSSFRIVSKTENIDLDIQKLCEFFSCSREQLVFFDDDKELRSKLGKLSCRVVKWSR